jgi:hypothetical protein
MANGGLEKLMSNPMLRNMMEGMQNGGGMPDMSQVSPLAGPGLPRVRADRIVLRWRS